MAIIYARVRLLHLAWEGNILWIAAGPPNGLMQNDIQP